MCAGVQTCWGEARRDPAPTITTSAAARKSPIIILSSSFEPLMTSPIALPGASNDTTPSNELTKLLMTYGWPACDGKLRPPYTLANSDGNGRLGLSSES